MPQHLSPAASTLSKHRSNRWALATALISFGVGPAHAQVAGRFEHAEIVESSGVTASRKHPGTFWTINDSGGMPKVYAFDLRGREKGAWHLQGATNRDWEAIALGPCPEGDCLYIADTGDNDAVRSSVTIYRLPEPRVQTAGEYTAIGVSRIMVRYPEGPRDAEAIYVGRDGTIWIVSKGREGASSIYRVRNANWAKGTASLTRVRATPLRIDGPSSFITDAALNPAGNRLALRTYTDLYVFAADQSDGEIRSLVARCDLQQLGERQGEGVTWTMDGSKLVTTSEGTDGRIFQVVCPVP